MLFDARALANPAVRATAKQMMHSLRQRPWLRQGMTPHRCAIYLLVNSGEEGLAQELVAELGLDDYFDDYFVESLSLARAQLVERLHQGGRFICYVGVGQDDDAMAVGLCAPQHHDSGGTNVTTLNLR